MKNVWQGVKTICERKTPQTEKLMLLDPISGKIISESKGCADLFAQTFSNKVDQLIHEVGVKDSMLDKITENCSTITDVTSLPQFATQNIISVIH